MQSEKENMEQFFDNSWEHMHGLLDEHFPAKEKKKKRFILWWWWGMAAALIAVGAMLWLNGLSVADSQFKPQNITHSEIEKPNDPTPSPKTQTQITQNNTDENEPIKSTVEDLQENTADVISPQNKLQTIDIHQANLSTRIIQSPNLNSERKQPKVARTTQHDLSLNPALDKKAQNEKIPSLIKGEDQILTRLGALKPLPQIAPSLLFAQASDITIHKNKAKRKLYYELYTGVSLSSQGYQSGFAGLSVGRPLTNRLSVEQGLGCRTIVASRTAIDSLTKTVAFGKYFEQMDYANQFSGLNSAAVEGRESIRLYLIDLPLKLRYQLTPSWSIYADMNGVYQLDKKVPNPLHSNSVATKEKSLPVTNLKGHAYIGLGGGISLGKNHLRLNVGYNNWAWFKGDSQYNVGLRYRF